MAGVIEDEIMKVGRWKTEKVQVAKCYIRWTTCTYTGPAVKEQTGTQLRDWERSTTISGVNLLFSTRAPKYAQSMHGSKFG